MKVILRGKFATAKDVAEEHGVSAARLKRLQEIVRAKETVPPRKKKKPRLKLKSVVKTA